MAAPGRVSFDRLNSNRGAGRHWLLGFTVASLVAIHGAAGLDTLRLRPGERILVIAPHPDDDVLGCGGLIQHALAAGDSVWVAYMTSGDGSWSSAAVTLGKPFIGAKDYLRLGRERMAEATDGARVLGLPLNQLIFLGYPDRGLAPLWQEYWNDAFKSPATAATRNPYCVSGRRYTGARVLADVMALLRRLRPDRVFAPHPCDAHTDHWATAAIMALAREVWNVAETTRFPLMYGYMVHYSPLPEPDEELTLSPPRSLCGPRHHWLSLPLTDVELARKENALDRHVSQTGTPGNNLAGRIGLNELFDEGRSDTGPVLDNAPAAPLPTSARFDTLVALPDRGTLTFRVLMKSRPTAELRYSLFIHAVGRDLDSILHRGLIVDLHAGDKAAGVTIMPEESFIPAGIRVEPVPRGWEVGVPRALFPQSCAVLYSAETRWGSMLLNHSGLGEMQLPSESGPGHQ